MSRRPWEAEVEVTENLAATLIESQFPQLIPAMPKLFGEGWDNTAFLVHDTYVFRFPRRQLGGELMASEVKALTWVGQLNLPLAVPKLEFIGQPQDQYPWSFAGYRQLPGATACRLALTDAERVALAPVLGRFLRALHSANAQDWELSGDTLGRLNIQTRSQMVRDNLKEIVELGFIDSPEPWLQALQNISETGRPSPHKCLVHGDLYLRHILLANDRKAVTGIIDWGDVHWGDPAVDLNLVYTFIPSEGREAFFEAYGDRPSQGPLQLARFRALQASTALVLYGHHSADGYLLREGLKGMQLSLFE